MILIASHISNKRRIHYLQECLQSISQQSQLNSSLIAPNTFSPYIRVYISISFETEELKDETINLLQTFSPKFLQYKIQPTKTSQFKHYQSAVQDLACKYDWYWFCDDDDTYEPDRIATFINIVKMHEHDPAFTGVYESSVGQTHQQYRYEYWAYCVRSAILERFFAVVQDDEVLDNKCCDILLVEYLRRLDPTQYTFYRIDVAPDRPLYRYRKTDNETSVTETILKSQQYLWTPNPPPITDPGFADYIVRWNEYLHDNLDFYMHDMFLRTVVGCDLEYILRTEFQADYPYLDFVDVQHKERMIEQYEKTRDLCVSLYMVMNVGN
jgi:glycosyltransferase involved in cell wall biosynthesis